jgi:hypothetical protein
MSSFHQSHHSSDSWNGLHESAHKSLFTVEPGKGLPIGNLTSQFFANVYLNQLDQFIKHHLKAKYYLRYVDDFVLLHEDRQQLYAWKQEIEHFLQHNLQLQLHPKRQMVRPVSNGIDFVGYITRPSHLLVRKRTVAKCRESLTRQTQAMTRTSPQMTTLHFPSPCYEKLRATLNSYLGIFRHASCHRLFQAIWQKFTAVRTLFHWQGFRVIPRWKPPAHPAHLYAQYRYFRARFRGRVLLQVGCYLELADSDATWAARTLGLVRLHPRRGFYARCGVPLQNWDTWRKHLRGENVLLVIQTGRSAGNVMERIAVRMD